MGFDSLDQAGYLSLLKRLQGRGGYSDDDSSNVVKEWNAVAKIAALVSEKLESAGRNMFLSQAVELLLDYERLYMMPPDERLADAGRQARFKAMLRALPKMIEARLDAALDAYLGATSGITIRPTTTEASTAGAHPHGGLYVQRQEPSADSQEARVVDAILSRGLPARALGGVMSTANATFGTGSIDRKSINTTPAVSPGAQTKSKAAVYEYYPGSVIKNDDWLEQQAMLCWKSRGFTISQANQGRTIIVAGEIDASATVAIDGPSSPGTNISWHDRFVQAWGVFSDTDVQPGGAAEDISALGATKHCWLGLSKLGNAGAAYVHNLKKINGGTAIGGQLTVNAAGDLELINTVAATRFFVLMITCTPVHTIASTTDTQPWMSTTDVANADLTELYQSTVVRDGDAPTAAGWTKMTLFGVTPAVGAMRRLIYTGGLVKSSPQDGVRNIVTLDSSEDWRDRYLLIVPITKTDSAKYPAASSDGLTKRTADNERPRLFFTGAGATAAATVQPYQHGDQWPSNSPNIWIYADSTTGHLMADMKETDATDNYADLMALVIASEKWDGTSVVTAAPLHATQIHAHDLNQTQNNGCIAQGFQGNAPRATLSAAAKGAIPTSPPLGLLGEGGALPRRPLSFLVRERCGDISDSTYEWRQKLTEQRRRIISLSVAAGATIDVDLFNDPTCIAPGTKDQMDLRDRFIWYEGKYAATDIRVTASPQVTDVAEPDFSGILYTGPFGDATLAVSSLTFTFVFSRKGSGKGYHSRLTVTNGFGSTRYFNLALVASGFLGLTDRRLYGATP